ncbi:hypothetical protein G7047_03640 [Diaphorobacter sp. HDW4A]|uniref:pyruvate formate lyase family protein n=1 Tax=Diaphorobacter sp. HDW4A TaxID=2714924 RepID=UPI00140BDCE8|nr:pyruvate formate lyase family protein [Diaphorobacter sp. HDW4A]QIL79105.1 hypothetical protein G7047_03640 [Diaphorobacter sp. HDW4A]
MPPALSAALRAVGMSSTKSSAAGIEVQRAGRRLNFLDVHAPQIVAAHEAGLLHGMPEPLSRCALAADYRRIALYGVEYLRSDCRQMLRALNEAPFTQELMQQRRSLSEQMLALEELRDVALSQGVDISRPAANAHEAVQWMTLAAMALAGESNGAAFPSARASAFLDVYIQRDMDEGLLNEQQAQLLIDEWLLKLSNMRLLCGAEPNAESGDAAVLIECLAGMAQDAQPLVTRTTFRWLQALRHCTAEHLPNVAALWSSALPRGFRNFCSEVARETGVIRFENDTGLRSHLGDDYVVCSSAPALRLGQQVLLDAGHVNLPKALLYAINGGVDEESGVLVARGLGTFWGDVLEYDDIVRRLDRMLDWLATNCVNAFNSAHFLHDRLADASLSMALHDSDAEHVMACSVDGLAVLADSLSAIRYARVQVLRNEDGLAVDFKVDESFPACGRIGGVADEIAHALCDVFAQKLRAQPFIYRNAQPVVVPANTSANTSAGAKTGSTPCGRHAGEAFTVWSTDEVRRWSTGQLVRDRVREDCETKLRVVFAALAEAGCH